MVDFEKEFGKPSYSTAARETQLATTFKLVYGWMSAGLALSGVIAWYAFQSGLVERILTGGMFTVCVIAELALVFILSMAINRLPAFVATLMFLGYAALNGLTLSVIFVAYELALVQKVFFITAAMFGGLAVWGTVTKGDLPRMGSICGMALWGLIIAGIVNIFTRSSGLDWISSFAGILIFSGLTMWDAQKIRLMAAQERTMDSSTVRKLGIMGALALYLDFINLFLHILRFMGRKR